MDEEIFILADPPHLLKNIRNALLNHGEFTIDPKYVEELNLPSNKVKWEYIKKMVEFQEERQLRICPHLTKADIDIGTYSKMKVKFAKHVFSKETAESIKFCCEHYPEIFPAEAMTTSVFCSKIGHYFDIMTARGLGLAFSKKNPEKLQEAFDHLEWFVGFYTSMLIGKKHKGGLLPTQRGIILATKSMIELTRFMLDQEGIKFLRPGMVGNDPIENFHSCVRARNKKPTCLNFMRITKAICMTQCLDGAASGSYDQDGVSESIMIDIKALKEAKEQLDVERLIHENEASLGDLEAMEDLEFSSLLVGDDIAELNALAYITGYLLRKTICSQSKCDLCKSVFVADENDQQMNNQLIRLRDYRLGALCRPTEVANKMFQQAENIFRVVQEKLISQKKTRLGDKISSAILLHWKAEFPQLPTCHLKVMANRFAKVRLLFFSSYATHHLETREMKKLAGASRASQSTVPIYAPNMK